MTTKECFLLTNQLNFQENKFEELDLVTYKAKTTENKIPNIKSKVTRLILCLDN